MHIGFERSTFENDICLLQLSQNVKANPNIAPVCLPQDRMSDNFVGKCFIAGWGVLAENTNTIPTILQEAEVPYVKHDRCQTIFQKVKTHLKPILKQHLEIGLNLRFSDLGSLYWHQATV